MVRGRANMVIDPAGRTVDIPVAELCEASVPGFALPGGGTAFASADLAKQILGGLPVLMAGPLSPGQRRVIEDVRRKCRPLLDQSFPWWEDVVRKTPEPWRYLARLLVGCSITAPRALRVAPGPTPEARARRAGFGMVVAHWSAGSTCEQARTCCATMIEPSACEVLYMDLGSKIVLDVVAEAEAAMRYVFTAPAPSPLQRLKRFIRRR